MAMKNDKKSFEDVNHITNNARLIVKGNNRKVLHIGVVFVGLIVFLLIWAGKSISEDESRLNQQKELKAKAETLISSGEYLKAEQIVSTMENEDFVIELKSKIQLEALSKRIDSLEVYLDKKKYAKLRLELEKITWVKNSKDSDGESIERESYRIFLKKKEVINNQLPEKYKVEIESEYSL